MAHGLPNFGPSMCPVCGFPELAEPPRYSDGGASYEICPSCGIQFGYDDDAVFVEPVERQQVYDKWRQRWIEEGMHWSSVGQSPPAGWNPEEQARNVK
jgi:hypothetical protein